jgi:hypothetical protein
LIRWSHLLNDARLGNGEAAITLTPVVQILLASSAVLPFARDFGRSITLEESRELYDQPAMR